MPLTYKESESAPGRIRTSDSRFRKPLLYPLSYRRVGSPVYPTKGKPSISLIRCFGFWDEVVVEQGREHAARYRADYADPDGVEMSSHERRSQGSHGFAEPPVTGPALSTPQARAKPTARGHTRWDPLVGGYRDHYEDQDKGDQDLHQKRPEVPDIVGGMWPRGGLPLAPDCRRRSRCRRSPGYLPQTAPPRTWVRIG